MNIGLDIGYSHTKAVTTGKRTGFPSIVGTPDVSRFSLEEPGDSLILTHPVHVQVGEHAISQSRFTHRREDRAWIYSDEWYTLALTAMTECTLGSPEMNIVTGLPVSFYSDREIVRTRLLGEHKVQRAGRRAQSLRVTHCRVIPQPFGTLLSMCLGNNGRVINQELATGNVGVIDVGGKTTNLLSVSRLSEISRETVSIPLGAWDVVRAVKTWLTEHCPALNLRDHQVISSVISREVSYYGESVDLTEIVDQTLSPMAEQVLSEATQLWNGGAGLNVILITGGGARLLGPRIVEHFLHGVIVDDPVYANSIGYYKLSMRSSR